MVEFSLEIFLAMTESLDFLRELLVILLRVLRRLLELLVFGLVLFENVEQLLFLFDLNLGLLLVRLDLLLEVFRLRVDLSCQSIFDSALLAILLAELRSHELHLLCALLRKLLVLRFKVQRLLLNQLIFFFRLRHIFRHLLSDSAEMFVEVFENFLALRLLFVLDRDVALLELRVLRIVLARNLLVLLTNDVGLCAAVLVLQCLLVVQLLFDLSFDSRSVDALLQRVQLVQEEVVESVGSLLERQLCCDAGSILQLRDFGHKLPVQIKTSSWGDEHQSWTGRPSACSPTPLQALSSIK